MTINGQFGTIPAFLALPLEIRDEIYRHLFSPANCKYRSGDEFGYQFDLRILQTSRTIYQEASRVFYAENKFAMIETPWPQAEQYIKAEGVPIVASPGTCSDFKKEQLHIDISSPGVDKSPTDKFLIHIDDVPKFCTVWFYSHLTYVEMNSHLCLELTLINRSQPGTSLPRETQKRLLEPFGMIKSLGKFEIAGDVDADVLAQVKERISQPLDSPTACIDKCIALLTAGDAKVERSQPAEAIEIYREAFLAIHIVLDGKFDRRIYAERYFEGVLSRPIFGNQSAGYARVVLRIKLVAAMMYAYLIMGDWDMVYYWGIRSIRLYRRTLGEGADEPGHASFPAPTEWGKIYYRTALAAEQIGRDEDAREFYPIAQAWLPGDESVTKASTDFFRSVGGIV